MMRLALLAAALLLLPAAADPPRSIDGLPIGGLPPQALPRQGCAAYLFTTGATRTFAVMVTAQPAGLRFSMDGKVVDLVPAAATPAVDRYGFAAQARYAGSGVEVALQMTVAERRDLNKGAAVPEATLRIDRAGIDSVVVPLAGLVGCA